MDTSRPDAPIRRKRSLKQFRRVHTRKIDRMVAKHNILKSGASLHDIIKRGYFSMQWKKYANAL